MDRCKCGRPVNWRLHGVCLACMYEAALKAAAQDDGDKKKITGVRLRIDPARLPKPPRPATKAYRGMSPEDKELKKLYEAAKRQEEMKARYENRKKQYHPQNYYTEEEDRTIREMTKAGSPIKEIAAKLNRPYPSIVARRKRLQVEDEKIKKILEDLLE